jgi:UDP-3-O-[3-hydroxymyristoyl] glucosamine N-acyltransferase
MTVKNLAALLNAPFEGDGEAEIQRMMPLEDAGSREISFAQGKALAQAQNSRAACVIVPLKYENAGRQTIIRVPDPRAAAARVIATLHPAPATAPGIHPSAAIAPDAVIDATASIGPLVTVGSGSHIGARTSVGAGSTIGDNVTIGAGCTIHAHVTIYRDVAIGNEVVLHSGCVIGADGFGFVMTGGAYEKFPQVGRVEIGDRVEIGATSCVDRAALGVTRIGEGTKLDNMVHIGHNCDIGKHVVVAAQTGFSGGVKVGDYAIIGGQVGIGDKVRIESRAVLGSGSGVLTSKIVRAGEVMWGTPARPLREYLKQLAVLSKLAKKA